MSIKKLLSKCFFTLKKVIFSRKGWKPYFSPKYCHYFKYVISMLWEIFWGALHVCRSKIGDVENSFHICHIFESPQPRGCSWRGYATQEADQELKWKLRTWSVWKVWVLEFLGPYIWNTKGLQYHEKPRTNRVKMKHSPEPVNRFHQFILIDATWVFFYLCTIECFGYFHDLLYYVGLA